MNVARMNVRGAMRCMDATSDCLWITLVFCGSTWGCGRLLRTGATVNPCRGIELCWQLWLELFWQKEVKKRTQAEGSTTAPEHNTHSGLIKVKHSCFSIANKPKISNEIRFLFIWRRIFFFFFCSTSRWGQVCWGILLLPTVPLACTLRVTVIKCTVISHKHSSSVETGTQRHVLLNAACLNSPVGDSDIFICVSVGEKWTGKPEG